MSEAVIYRVDYFSACEASGGQYVTVLIPHSMREKYIDYPRFITGGSGDAQSEEARRLGLEMLRRADLGLADRMVYAGSSLGHARRHKQRYYTFITPEKASELRFDTKPGNDEPLYATVEVVRVDMNVEYARATGEMVGMLRGTLLTGATKFKEKRAVPLSRLRADSDLAFTLGKELACEMASVLYLGYFRPVYLAHLGHMTEHEALSTSRWYHVFVPRASA